MAAEDRKHMTPQKARRALETLGKWRTVYAGWQLGTRSKEDPEAAAVRDLQEARLAARAEGSAVVSLLIEKGVFTHDEFVLQLGFEAQALSDSLATRFVGMRATPTGITVDHRAAKTMRGWKP